MTQGGREQPRHHWSGVFWWAEKAEVAPLPHRPSVEPIHPDARPPAADISTVRAMGQLVRWLRVGVLRASSIVGRRSDVMGHLQNWLAAVARHRTGYRTPTGQGVAVPGVARSRGAIVSARKAFKMTATSMAS